MSSGWTLQKQKRAKGLYFQAVTGKGADRRAVTLGYLSEEEAEAGLVRLRSLDGEKARKVVDEAVVPLVSDEAIRRWALDNSVEEAIADVEEAFTRLQIDSGSYAEMHLRDFVKHVWEPTRSRGWSAPGSKKQHGPATAAKTWDRERHLWTTILKVIGDVRIKNLDADKWSKVLRSNPNWGRRSQVLAQNAYTIMLRFCKHRKIIKEIHEFDVILGDEKPKRKVTPFLAEEAAALLAAGDVSHRALWLLSLGSGLRIGEAVAARYEDIGWGAGTIHIKGTKNEEADRHLPLPPDVFDALRAHRDAAGCPSSGWMFPSDSQTGHVQDIRKSLQTAAKKAGITLDRIHPNQLRHSFASIAAIKAVPKVVTRAYMGHTGRSEMLERYYEHARPEQLTEGMRSFPSLGPAAK